MRVVSFQLIVAALCQRVSQAAVCELVGEFVRHTITSDQDFGMKATIIVPDNSQNAGEDGVTACLTSSLTLWQIDINPVALATPSVGRCHNQLVSCLNTIANNGLLIMPFINSPQLYSILQAIFVAKSEVSVSITTVLLTSAANVAQLKTILAHLDVNLATDMRLATFSDNMTATDTHRASSQYVMVSEVYRVCDLCNLTSRDLYSWSRDNVTVYNDSPKVIRRSNLQGATLNGVGVYVFQIYTKTRVINDTLTPLGGIFYRLVRSLSQKFNFKLNITFLEGYSYGKNLGNLTYNGMVGALQFGRADMTISELSETAERRLLIDYSSPLSMLRRRVYVKLDEDVESWITRYTRGISAQMTLALFGFVLLLGTVLKACEWLLNKACRQHQYNSLYDCLWTTYGALMQQGSPNTPTFSASRIVFMTAFFTALLVYTAYSATLISFLAARTEPTPLFSDLRGLLRYPAWRVGWKRRELIENFMDWCYSTDSPLSECDTIRRIWELHTSEQELVDSYEEGFRKVAAGQFAFVAPEEAADYVLAHMDSSVSCGVLKLPESYLARGIAIGLVKNSPYKPLINYGIRVLLEGGVVDKLYQDEIGERQACASLSGDTAAGAGAALTASLQHTLGAFVVLICGAVASLLVVAVEKHKCITAPPLNKIKTVLSLKNK